MCTEIWCEDCVYAISLGVQGIKLYVVVTKHSPSAHVYVYVFDLFLHNKMNVLQVNGMFVASAGLFAIDSDSVVNTYHIPAQTIHITFHSVSSVYNHMYADRGMELCKQLYC